MFDAKIFFEVFNCLLIIVIAFIGKYNKKTFTFFTEYYLTAVHCINVIF